MRKLFILLLAAPLLLVACNMPQRMIRFSPMLLDSLKASSKVDLPAYEKKYGKYDGVFLLTEDVIEHATAGANWQCYRMRTLRYLVLNPDAEWLSTFNVGVEEGSDLESVSIHIINPDGTARSYGLADLKQTRSDGETVYKLAYPDIRKGTIVQESYEMRMVPGSSDAMRPSINVQYAVPVERLIYQYAVPESWKVVFKDIAPGKYLQMKRTVYHRDQKAILSYEAQDVPPIVDEPYAPYFREVANYIECMVVGSTQVGNLRVDGWESISSPLKALIDDDTWSSSAVKEVVDTVIAGRTSDREKLDAITKFVQKNVAVSYSDYDMDVRDVLRSGQGNVLKICALTRGMLEDAGIPARILLGHSARNGYFDANYISPDQLDAPMVEATIGERRYILFPYLKNYPIDIIPDHLQEQKALVIGGEKGFGGFTQTPSGDSTANTLDDDYRLVIDEEGNITVEEERSLRGALAFWQRQRLADMNEEDLKREMKDILTYSDGDVELKEYEVIGREDYDKPLVFKMRYTIDNLVTVTPDEVIFQTGGLFSPSSNGKTKVDTDERQNPIRIYGNEQLNKKVVISYPSSWTLTTKLDNTSQSNELGTISGSYSIADGSLTVEHHRLLKRTNAPKEKAPELLAVTGRKSRLNIPSLVFKVNR